MNVNGSISTQNLPVDVEESMGPLRACSLCGPDLATAHRCTLFFHVAVFLNLNGR